ncbi:MAG: PLP-dependent transferase, partial [Planctomycetaceae bacterium]|nr:PLP-dependent transferase [Planctomycetaceae bacterium]
YVRHAVSAVATVQKLPDQSICGVTVEADHFPVLKQYWQHAGENASSRTAELLLADRSAPTTETAARRTVRRRIADFQNCSADDVRLFPSGMAAIAAAWRAVSETHPGRSCQFGFPYVDTLKIQQRFPGAHHEFLPLGDTADLQQLDNLCANGNVTSIFCEVPTNPLLKTPDVGRLRQIADRRNVLLVIDDTLAACGNLQLLDSADILVTSLTKYFSGYGNVLAGSLVVNPHGRHAAELNAAIAADFEETLSDADTDVLFRNSADYESRTARINDNALQLADHLSQHSRVQYVYHPSLDRPIYDSLRRRTNGYGGLLSIQLRDAPTATPSAFDRLNVCKGPNLGTNFTLCCPYTILAHYNELDFAERCGVSRWLLRISVGTEDITDLISRFEHALSG